MRLYRYLLLCAISLLVVLTAAAQTQQGYVKTLGRPQQAGVALSGVSVRVKGAHNAVLSQSDGTFSILLTGKKPGDAYTLQQVQKQGYELNERAVIGRQYAYSDKVPMTIVMVSTAQLQADKQRIENKAYQVAERNYKKQLALIEKQKADNSITIEAYRQQLQDLQDRFEKYQSLIDGLAEHYAHVDYDQLDEKEREINLCIESGELERADSLIHTLFDPTDVLKRNQEALARLDQQESQARELLAQANADWAAVLKQQEKDAEYLYQLYTVAIGKFEFERAGRYIETRAELDTTNAAWQHEAAYYLQKQNQYHKVERYYVRALDGYRQLALENPQVHKFDVAKTLNNLALLYFSTQRFKESEAMYIESLEISQQQLQQNPQAYEPIVATTLANLANLYKDTKRFTESEEKNKEALEIRRRLAQQNPQVFEYDLSQTLNGLAGLYSDIQRLTESEAMYQEALEISRRLAQQNPQTYEPDVAITLDNLASLYYKTQRFMESEAMYKEALVIRRRLAQSNPQGYDSHVATTLNNLAHLYSATRRLTECETMYREALGIYHRLAQTNPQAYEPLVAKVTGNLAILYSNTQRFAESESMYKKALEIFRQLAQQYPRAYEADVALVQYNLGHLEMGQKQYADAAMYFEHALEIYRRLAKQNPIYQRDYEGSVYYLSQLYTDLKKYVAAYRINKEWLPILKKIYEKNPEKTKGGYAENLGVQSIYGLFLKQFAESEQYAREGFAVDPTKHWIAANLAHALLFQGKYAEAEKIYREYKAELKDSFLGDFRQFAEAGVIPKEREADVERIKRMLNE